MIRIRNSILVLGAAAAIFCASCAPEPPPETGSKPPATESSSSSAEVLAPPAATPDALRTRVEEAIKNIKQRDLLTTNGFWTVFHGILGLGLDVTLLDETTHKRTNAIDYIANGGKIRGMEFIQTKDGLDVETGRETFVSQGHQDQFIAEMAEWGMKPGQKFKVNDVNYTFMDFIRHAKARASIKANQELSWAIIIISQFYGTDISWTNSAGENLRFEGVVRYELDQPIDDAACGGTHRLFGLSWAYHLHRNKGGHKIGVWQDVADKSLRYQQRAKELQNSDGSFSTEFFKKRDSVEDKQRRIYTTGHTLEWLAFSLPDTELDKAWVQNAVDALARMILDIQNEAMESGALYHAVHGLLLYHHRVWGKGKPDALDGITPWPPKEN